MAEEIEGGEALKVRKQFVSDLRRVIGDMKDTRLPFHVKPTLYRLIQECDYYIEKGNESTFMKLCEDAIEVSSLGGGHRYYSLFFGLKEVLIKHKKHRQDKTSSKILNFPIK